MRLAPKFINSSMGGGVLANGYSVNSSEKRSRKADFSVADTMIVESHDPNGQLIDTLARIPNGRWGQDDHEALRTYWLPRLFCAGAEVDAGGSTVALAYGMNTEVRVLDDEFNLRLIVRWAEPGREVTGADVDAWREDYVENRPRPDFSPMAEAHDAMISEERPVAELFPAISSVMVGSDGRIWVPPIRPAPGRPRMARLRTRRAVPLPPGTATRIDPGIRVGLRAAPAGVGTWDPDGPTAPIGPAGAVNAMPGAAVQPLGATDGNRLR